MVVSLQPLRRPLGYRAHTNSWDRKLYKPQNAILTTKSAAGISRASTAMAMQNVGSAQGVVNKYGINEAEYPQIDPPCYIMSWVDYSNRYGFAYQISNGSIGVIFNDESAAILSPNALIVDYSPSLLDAAFDRALFEEGLPFSRRRSSSSCPSLETTLKIGLLCPFQQPIVPRRMRS